MSQKRSNFVRLAEARVAKAMKAIRVIGNLSNQSNYEYSDQDIKEIVQALQKELSDLQVRFKLNRNVDQPEFKLRK